MSNSSDAHKPTPHQAPIWPSSPADLSDTTRCPACLTALRSAVCDNCGLDLRHPLAHELASLSSEIAEQFAARSALIDRIRRETAAAPAAIPVPVPVPAPVPVVAPAAFVAPGAPLAPVEPAAAQAPAPAAPTPSATPVPAAAPVVPAATPRRSGVQLTLLVTGIVLVSVFAIFFMVYAFINYGLVWRSVIIGFVTLATLVSASILRRRRLASSAEGLAALGVVLLLLDVFAVRANGMLGSDRIDGAIYWGTALLALSGVLWLWHSFARVRTGRVAASILLIPGAFTLAAGITGLSQPTDYSGLGAVTVPYTAALIAALAGLLHLALPRRASDAATDAALPERIILLAFTAPSLLMAAFLSLVIAPGFALGGALALLGVAIVAAAHWYSHASPRRDALDRGVARGFAAVAGVLTVAAVAAVPLRLEWAQHEGLVWVLPAVTALLAAIIWFVVARPALPGRPLGTRSSTVGALGVAVITLTPPLVIAAGTLLNRVVEPIARPRTLSFDHINPVAALPAVSVVVLAGPSSSSGYCSPRSHS